MEPNKQTIETCKPGSYGCDPYAELEYHGKQVETAGWLIVAIGLLTTILGAFVVKKGKAMQKKAKELRRAKND